MELQERRNFLVTTDNPDVRLDYVASIEGEFPVLRGNAGANVFLRYIPDRAILEPPSFSHYLEAIGAMPWASLEEAAVTILNDISNQVVPRWTQVSVSVSEAGSVTHTVLLEDRQPRWENRDLLSRLKPH